MYDDFDDELDKGPEGSIITPIFLGCGAMGLGCLFSVGAIAIALMIFVPGLWTILSNLTDEDSLMNDSLPLVMANLQVVEYVGEPVETELEDIDADSDENISFEIGDEIVFTTIYNVTGPSGSAVVTAVGGQHLVQDSAWTFQRITAVLDDGTLVQILPSEMDTPPPPAQLAPFEEAPVEIDSPDMSEIEMDDGPEEEVVSEPADD